jgi:amino-acid N-acetyltransferase
VRIEIARAEDAPAVKALIRQCGLPVEDIDAVSGFLVARDGGAIAGTVGLERLGKVGLLRSLAVKQEERNHGLGRALCERALDNAKKEGLRAMYLLTTDAQPFFRKLEFSDSPRDSAPREIRSTAQFRTLCPDTATLMARDL